MDNKILEKIKKCLALAKSDNPNEAATALRQAQSLMAKYGVTSEALELSEVEAKTIDAGAGKTPPQWIVSLICLVRTAFAVDVVYSATPVNWTEWHGQIEFIGLGGSPEVAGYAYEVLLRQLKKGRADYLKTLNKRLLRATKTRRGDLYAEGWVDSVRQQIVPQHLSPKSKDLVSRYKEEKHKNLSEGKAIDRTSKARQHDASAYFQGLSDGKNVNFHSGVKADQKFAIEGGKA